MNIKEISVTVLTKNSAKYLKEVLDAVKDFGEVLIYDTGSQDATLEIAKGYPCVKVIEGPFDGFGATHNKASNSAKYDWILSVDSDEVVSNQLKDEIIGIDPDPSTVYSISRKNYYGGKWIYSCGWSPDRQYKIYNRTKTCFNDMPVHEAVITKEMKIIKLKEAIIHRPYETTEDFLHKMQSYSTLFAQQYQGKRSSSLGKAIFRGFYTFIKCYFIKRGFLQGSEGFIISWYNANTTYFKYLKLAERNKMSSECNEEENT